MDKQKPINLPNFLIVAPPKCATKSLYYYLKQHPEIFMSKIKGPEFILAQFADIPEKGIGDDKKHIVKDYHDYVTLFKGAEGKKAIGEASVSNLYYYEKAIPHIRQYFGNPKIIIMLRNPVERAFSAYKWLLFQEREWLSFEGALDQEPGRKKEGWRVQWYYQDAGFYHDQVNAYLSNFGHVKVCLFDDLLKDALSFVQDIYQFLGVDPHFVPDTSLAFNISGAYRYGVLNKFIRKSSMGRTIIREAGHFLFKEGYIKVRDMLNSKLVSKTQTVKMESRTKHRLADIYREDILKLQALIGRDLSSWLDRPD